MFLIQLAIKRLFKFPPRAMCAFALPGKSKTGKICIKINQKVNKFNISGSVGPSCWSNTIFNCRAAV